MATSSAASLLAGAALAVVSLWLSPSLQQQPQLLLPWRLPADAPSNCAPRGAPAPPTAPRRPQPTCAPALEASLALQHPAALQPYRRQLPGNLSRAGVAGGPSSLASPACPMLVLPPVLPPDTPPAAALLAWAMTASVAENFGATLVRRPLLGGAAWEAALGLAQGVEGEAEWEAVEAQLAARTLRLVQLPGWRGVRYDEDALRRGPWWDAFNDPAHCGAALELPAQGRSWDAVWLSKGAAAAKYALARAQAAQAARAGGGGGASEPPLLWQAGRAAGDIVIAVHARRVHVAGSGGEEEGAAPPAAAASELLDAPLAPWRWSRAASGGGWVYCPTPDAALARVIRDTVLPAFAAAAAAGDGGGDGGGDGAAAATPPLRLRLHVHVFSQLAEGESGSAALPALAALPVASVRFHGPAAADEWATLHHLAASDILVGSASQWSQWAAHLSSAPLVLAQADSDTWRQCGEGEACCFSSGECPYAARAAAAAAAVRLLAREQCRQAREAAEAAGGD